MASKQSRKQAKSAAKADIGEANKLARNRQRDPDSAFRKHGQGLRRPGPVQQLGRLLWLPKVAGLGRFRKNLDRSRSAAPLKVGFCDCGQHLTMAYRILRGRGVPPPNRAKRTARCSSRRSTMEKPARTERFDCQLSEPLRELTKDELALVNGGVFGEMCLGVLNNWISDAVKEMWHWLQNRICRGQH